MENSEYNALPNQMKAIIDVGKFNAEQKDDIKCFETVMKKRNVRLYSIMGYASIRLATLYYSAEPYIMASLDGDIIEVDKAIIWDIARWDEQNKHINTLTMSCRDMLIDVYHISEEYVDDIMASVDESKRCEIKERLTNMIRMAGAYERDALSKLKSHQTSEYRKIINTLAQEDSNWGKLAGTMYYLSKMQQSSISSSQISAESQAKRMIKNGFDPNGCELGLTCSGELIRRMISINAAGQKLLDKLGDKEFAQKLKNVKLAVEAMTTKDL